MNRPREIIVHHDGVRRDGASFDIINQYHKEREFPISSLGFYCGYHYFIEYDGTVIQARKEDETGAHTIGHNNSSVGVALAGNFDNEMPRLAQVVALSELLYRIAGRYNIEADMVFPHRRFAEKTCYGNNLEFTWAARLLVDETRKRLIEVENRLNHGV